MEAKRLSNRSLQQCCSTHQPVWSARPVRLRQGPLVVRAQILADKPSSQTVPSQQISPEQQLSNSNSYPDTPAASPSSTSACPFLAAVQPPTVKLPWHKRFWQLADPYRMQKEVLTDAVEAGATMVQLTKTVGFLDAYMPATADAVKQVFAGETGSDPITAQSNMPSFVKLMGVDSLILTPDPQHKYLRGLLAPAFSPEAVATYLPQIQALMTRHMGEWVSAGEGGVKGLDAFKLLTFEFIVQLTLGRRYPREELLSLSKVYLQWTAGFAAWPWLDLPLTPYRRALQARKVMVQHFQEAVDAGRAKMAAGQEVPGLLGALLAAVDEEGNRLNDVQITDNILLLLLAGHDTSSTTLTQCFSNLQNHPAVVQKLREEQQQVVAKHGQQITAAALKDMHYADAVIRETLRLDPVVAGLMRVAARDYQLSGYSVPAGKPLILPLKYVAMKDPRWVDETGDLSPLAFVPERMLTPEGQKTGDLMPFGYGPRYCLGASLAMVEMKMMLALMSRSYAFTADNNTEWVQAVGKVPKNSLPIVWKPLTAESA